MSSLTTNFLSTCKKGLDLGFGDRKPFPSTASKASPNPALPTSTLSALPVRALGSGELSNWGGNEAKEDEDYCDYCYLLMASNCPKLILF